MHKHTCLFGILWDLVIIGIFLDYIACIFIIVIFYIHKTQRHWKGKLSKKLKKLRLNSLIAGIIFLHSRCNKHWYYNYHNIYYYYMFFEMFNFKSLLINNLNTLICILLIASNFILNVTHLIIFIQKFIMRLYN
jgi:hypothetical protein